ncbi:MAG: MarR family transcriptional regulator [Microbacterium sp.]|jgi:DNA-binding transcriptional regulator GbsR (MarR family)|uniref:MarR family protein n=2 Tax=Microbacteriaceae TaxID=85023 RepID=A0A0F0LXJ6_9MICO|nr:MULTISPECIES: helix-turn-helix domain-containing protein [unclassified Microbacterium]KJL42126.1 MarR family protein [Microbacterium ginsengisoli]MAL06385.1 MarR family transcriptional regulator [Microbacterium sp.]MCK9917293.1 MarR family transcriptional regulator [Microbacteriaceae bacterium K1510]KJL42133.1 MarR family protein [Microbacterium ginsengisoli]KQR91578.1 hypothetical protein ASF93_06575 [Microbacterium sp. Leaf347]
MTLPAHRALEPAEQAAAMMTAAGMARMPARVMMALVAAPATGYTAAELADRLGVSPAAVSGAVRYLVTLRFVHRRSVPGDRRDRYEIVQDGFYSSVALNAPVYARLATAIDEIGDAQDDTDADAVARARDLAEFFRFLAERMPALIDEWRARGGA